MTLEKDVKQAGEVLSKFKKFGFSLEKITAQLTEDGVKSFEESFVSLLATIEARRDAAIRNLGNRITFHLGDSQGVVDAALQRADKDKCVERIWKKDATLWKSDDVHKKIISNALGWLTVVEDMQEEHCRDPRLRRKREARVLAHRRPWAWAGRAFARKSRSVFSENARVPDSSRSSDSTVPDAVRNLESRIDIARSLFMVASKSGSTRSRWSFTATSTIASNRSKAIAPARTSSL
jgi:transaldolase/glucose-6-phosphate isomerase